MSFIIKVGNSEKSGVGSFPTGLQCLCPEMCFRLAEEIDDIIWVRFILLLFRFLYHMWILNYLLLEIVWNNFRFRNPTFQYCYMCCNILYRLVQCVYRQHCTCSQWSLSIAHFTLVCLLLLCQCISTRHSITAVLYAYSRQHTIAQHWFHGRPRRCMQCIVNAAM